ncbi:MAG TPA: tetratricopeptide repeat protein [Acidobacteriota bacterium]
MRRRGAPAALWAAALLLALLSGCKKNQPTTLMRGQAQHYYQSGLAHLHRGDAVLAQQDFQRAIALDGSQATFFNALGLAFYAGNDVGRAIAAYEQALRIDPKLSEAHTNLGSAYSTLGDYPRAKQQFEIALADPKYNGRAAAHYNLGLIAQEQGDLDLAERHYAQALQADPRFYDAAIRRGEMLEHMSRLAEAIQSFELGLKARSDNLELTYKLAQLYYATGQRDRAASYARSIIQSAAGSEVSMKAVKLLELMEK